MLAVAAGSGVQAAEGGKKEDPLTGKLYWRNGDSLQGSLSGAEKDHLEWSSNYFASPVWLETPFLEAIVFDHPAPEQNAAGPFRAVLASGDVVHGSIKEIDQEYITITNRRHGDLRLERGEVTQVRRLDHPTLLYLGPNGRSGWSVIAEPWKTDHWAMRPGGGLQTKRWRAELFRSLQIPKQAEFEVMLSSNQRPEFAIAFSDDFSTALRLETWDNEVVLTQGSRFESVRSLSEGDTQVHYRVFANQETGSASIYSGTGELLASMNGVNWDTEGKSGVYLRNKGADLEFEKLRVSQWNGKTPSPLKNAKDRVHLIDGEVIYGRAVALDEENVTMEDGRQISLNDVDTIHFHSQMQVAAEPRNAEVSFPDGTLVSGQLEEVENGRARIRTTYSPDPVETDLHGAREIKFYVQADVPVQTSDELHRGDQILKGTIRGSEDPDAPIHWLPLGAKQSVPLKSDYDARIVRKQTLAVGNLDGDRLFLNTREIISCQIERLDDEHVHFETSLGGLTQLPLNQVRAIEFREGRLQLSGFTDRAWTEVENPGDSVARTAKTLELDGGALIHPSILRADEILFDLRWRASSHGAMSLGLFAEESLVDSRPPLEISFSCWSNRLWVAGAEPGVSMNLGGDDISISNGQAKVRIGLAGDDVRVWVNDQQLLKIRFEESKRLGNGLRFSSGSPWFDRVSDLGKTIVTNFEVRSTTGLLAPLRVENDAKIHALTIPRFRRESPDTHILISPTGDLLRGRLGRVDEKEIHFVSRLDELVFPRDRVAGIVCLDIADKSTEVQDKEARVILTDGTVIRLTPTKMTATTLHGESPSLGPCQLPTASIRQIHLGNVEPIAKPLVYADWEQVHAIEPVIPESGAGAGTQSELVGQKASNFALPRLNEGTFKVEDELGKVLVLEFWATWCGPCAKAFPEILKALKGMDPERVSFVAVNQAEPPDIVRRYLKNHGFEFEVIQDAQEKIAPLFGAEGLPHTVVIDQQGTITWVQSGFVPDESGKKLKEVVEGLLNNPPTSKGEAQTN